MMTMLLLSGCGASREEVALWHGEMGSSHTKIHFAQVSSSSQEASKEGVQRMGENDWPAAEASFRAATERDPSDHRSLYGLGVALEKQDKLPAAIEAYDRAAQATKPRSPANRKYREAARRVRQAEIPKTRGSR